MSLTPRDCEVASVTRVDLRADIKAKGTTHGLTAEELGTRIGIECSKSADGIAPVQDLTLRCDSIVVRPRRDASDPGGVLATLARVDLAGDHRLMYMLAGAIPVHIYDRAHPRVAVRQRPRLRSTDETEWYGLVHCAKDPRIINIALTPERCKAILAVEALR